MVSSSPPAERHPPSTLIAALPRLPQTGKFRILDPGAGSGSLSAAILARIVAESPQLDVELVGVEMDPDVVPYLRTTFEDCAAAASSGLSHFRQGSCRVGEGVQ